MAKSDDDTQRDNRKENDKIKSSDLEEETKLSRLFYLQLYSSVLNAEVGGMLFYITVWQCAVACKSSCKCHYILLINSLARKQEAGESEEEKATDSRRQEEGGKVAFMDGSMVQPAVQINK